MILLGSGGVSAMYNVFYYCITIMRKQYALLIGYGLAFVASIVSMAEVTEYLYNREVQGRVVIDDAVKTALDAYYEQYGAKE